MLMNRVRAVQRGERGFTLIELLVAMSVFSFMLVIVVTGFINIVRLHDEALAANLAQDNARVAMDELVRGVRNSTGAASATGTGASGVLCLNSLTGLPVAYYVQGGVLMRANDCAAHSNPAAITSSSVFVSDFTPAQLSQGPKVVRPLVQMSVTVGSNNGTTAGSGAALTCGSTNADRTFCSVVTLTSEAAPR